MKKNEKTLEDKRKYGEWKNSLWFKKCNTVCGNQETITPLLQHSSTPIMADQYIILAISLNEALTTYFE